MFRLRISIAWRMVVFFVILALMPIGVSFVFLQQQVRQNNIKIQQEVIGSQARIYSDRILAEPNRKAEIAKEMTNATGGDQFYLIDVKGTYLYHPDAAKQGRSAAGDFGFSIYEELLDQQSVVLLDERNNRIIGSYRQELTDPLAVSVENIQTRFIEAGDIPSIFYIQVGMILALSALGMWFAANWVTRPLRNLLAYAKDLSENQAGSTPVIGAPASSEIQDLKDALQTLAINLQKAAQYMESSFEERSRKFERRSALLKAVADVGKAITSFRNLSDILEQTTHLISENFGYYHVGIFLLDDYKDYAVLSAANSEGGKRMLARKHQLKVGETGIVGYVTQNAKARIALDVGADAVYFDNPDLAKTRSEMALPLVVSGQILGALDVQSTESQAFSEEDISTLQILAEQLAVAIQNANLLSETEKALEAARMVYGEMSRDAWNKILREQQRIGFIATPPGTVRAHAEVLETNLARAFDTGDVIMGSDNLTIGIPIKIRGQSIGAIRLKKSEISESWTQEEINLAVALSDQLSGALESARLYKESQQRGARESLVSDISTRISAASHTDAILRETVQELGQSIGNVSVTFQLLESFEEQKRTEIRESEYYPAQNREEGI